jgi:protein subunit release factor A
MRRRRSIPTPRLRQIREGAKGLKARRDAYREYASYEKTAAEARQLLDTGVDDAEFKELLREEYDAARESMAAMEDKLRILLLPRDPNDDKNVIVEIRGGAGGGEAALFAYNLYRMYSMYAETKRWKSEIAYINDTEIGGIKEVSFLSRATALIRALNLKAACTGAARARDGGVRQDTHKHGDCRRAAGDGRGGL